MLPPTGPLLLALAGLALLGRRPRLGRALAWLGLGALLVLSLPLVSHALLRSLEAPALDLRRPGEAQAIVILGGGIRRNAAEFGGDTLARLTLERVRYGALVARTTRLPVLVSGGSVFGGTRPRDQRPRQEFASGVIRKGSSRDRRYQIWRDPTLGISGSLIAHG